jgi:purine-binding chemotaxis protein CheW
LSAADDAVTVSGGLLLLVRLGERRYALPCAAVQRILPMAAPTPFPGAPAGVSGVLAFSGQLLPVIDPRPRLLLATSAPHPQQHLVVLHATTTFLLWVDRAETVEVVAPGTMTAIANADTDALAPHLMRLGGTPIPVLAPQAFDPGPFLRVAGGGR